MEYCNEGTLDEFIEKHKKIPEKEAIMILKHILNGIAVILRLFKELHTHRIIHRDLKA